MTSGFTPVLFFEIVSDFEVEYDVVDCSVQSAANIRGRMNGSSDQQEYFFPHLLSTQNLQLSTKVLAKSLCQFTKKPYHRKLHFFTYLQMFFYDNGKINTRKTINNI
jgi:hypothetical protein